jgi:hypothetical protein
VSIAKKLENNLAFDIELPAFNLQPCWYPVEQATPAASGVFPRNRYVPPGRQLTKLRFAPWVINVDGQQS